MLTSSASPVEAAIAAAAERLYLRGLARANYAALWGSEAISGRNFIEGKAVDIKRGATAHVDVEIAGAVMRTASITNEAR